MYRPPSSYNNYRLDAYFHPSYWNDRILIIKKISESLNLTYTLAKMKYVKGGKGDNQEWHDTVEARGLQEQIKAAEWDSRLCEKQRTSELTAKNGRQQAFIQLWTRPKNGLNITVPTGAGGRSTGAQSNFRANLITVSDPYHPSPTVGKDYMWCPIAREWMLCRATHIFAYHHGQDMMTSIFGAKAIGELFSVKNGILMSEGAGRRFDKGLFIIVPDVDKSASQHDIDAWNASEPKEYKIRVLDKDCQVMNQWLCPSRRERWVNLDGQRVAFRNNRRPRAEYLYFHYCVSILRRSWNQDKHWGLLKEELRGMWAAPGPYLPKSMLAAFIEELGHDMEPALMRGCEDLETVVEEVDPTALACANDQIWITSRSGHELLDEI